LGNSESRLVKARDLDTDELNGELVLLKLYPQRTIMLNAAGLALWQGLDAVDTRREAIELVKEALPAMDPGEVERAVEKLLDELVSSGFLIEMSGDSAPEG
jgi:Coenzyme PQQ synthesis protein D (PqqD)